MNEAERDALNEFISLACSMIDNLNDMPVSEEWAAKVSLRGMEILRANNYFLARTTAIPPAPEPSLRVSVVGILCRWQKDDEYDIDTCIRDLRAILAASREPAPDLSMSMFANRQDYETARAGEAVQGAAGLECIECGNRCIRCGRCDSDRIAAAND